MENNKNYDLNERLISFAVSIIKLAEKVNKNDAGVYLSGQLLRSGTSPALHYGEALSAESRKDFVHKLKILLKELRETQNNLIIMDKAQLLTERIILTEGIKECKELIAIFSKSIETAKSNMLKEKIKIPI